MRITRKVIDAWEHDRAAHPAESIWTDGRNIWSYQTCILVELEGGGAVMNVTRYSATTTRHQDAIRAELRGFIKQEIDFLPRGIQAAELAGMAIYVELCLWAYQSRTMSAKREGERMSGRYRVFVRNWYRRNPARPGGVEPNPGARKSTLGYVDSEESARDWCRVYAANHAPGKLSRKAEYERV